METVTLVDLAPIIAAILGPMLAAMLLLMRYQHQDSVKTRELISSLRDETRELISGSEKETRELISGSDKETREWVGGAIGRLERAVDRLSAEVKELGRSLSNARERLARIEGHLGIGQLRSPEEPGEQGGDSV